MKSTIVPAVMLLVALAPLPVAAAAGAEPATHFASALTLPSTALAGLAPVTAPVGIGMAGPSGEEAVLSSTSFASIRYRPRRGRRVQRSSNSYDSHGFTQLHGGAYDPDGDLSSAAMFGLRAGSTIDDRVQLGLGIDWSHRSDRQSVLVSGEPLPGGGTRERRLELSRTTSDLVPILAFLQVSPGGNLGFSPYLGIGGGYELLFISADDFETAETFDATFGGWGWQAWVGAAFPLSGTMRLNAEVFTNESEVSRDVDDPESGLTFREIVNVDGAGFRAGLSWGF